MAGTTKQLNRFIEQCLGQPGFEDRCESLIEFRNEDNKIITDLRKVWKNQ